MRWLASLLHGLQKAVTGADKWNESKITTAVGIETHLNPVGAFWDSESTVSVLSELTGRKITLPFIRDEPFDLNSFALHILLTSAAYQDVWSQEELEKIALKANHHLSVLLYCAIRKNIPQTFDEQSVISILDACPNGGPAENLPADSGWQHDNRWIRCTEIFEAKDGPKQYNGLDWMVLHNLHQLVFRAS